LSDAARTFLASAPRGFVDLLLGELLALGATDARERGGQVAFTGGLELAYRACLESRVASRVFLELARFEAADDAALYRALRAHDWAAHFAEHTTLACDFSGRHPAIRHTQFGALRLKDAICDMLRQARGVRPDVDTAQPGLRVHLHARDERCVLSLDLSGDGLHRRGWRARAIEAPLRENVAAGILLRAQWPRIAAEGGSLVDPMCGSGTIAIEGARIAADVAANLGRDYFGFLGWRQHDPAAWARVLELARTRAAAGLAALRARIGASGESAILARDVDARAVEIARGNARAAGVEDVVRFEVGGVATLRPPARAGLVCTNPPYGVRLGEREQARALHVELGRVLRERFDGWQAAILTGSPELGLELGLRAERVHVAWNGPIEGRLLRIQIGAAATRDLRPRTGGGIDPQLAATPGARMFANRIGKNLRVLSRWSRREQVGCYRIYDADMPEYAFAIDLYSAADGPERWLVVQEYAAPREIPEQDVRRRRSEALAALVESTGVPADHVHLKTRRRRARGEQYERTGDAARFHEVSEGGLRFLVNFEDYLDTGLFLDHRLTRARLREAARGCEFLNLFGYTGSASVYAAAGGAVSTTTVDLSNTYLDWAGRNLALNGFGAPRHRLVRADAREWLASPPAVAMRFGLIFLDPPTFSNSARMEGVWDAQRDHGSLIDACVGRLAPGGLLVFSTNAQRFELDPQVAARHVVADVTATTLPPDFARNTRIHRCFEVRARPRP
jgi:23S rRNA (guanine2445-N2)-methyltransferase / 23S rRNA (guanine2069-N7)-methyltransferase